MEELLVSDNKKEETKNLIKTKLVGVEMKDGYWEKRNYKKEIKKKKKIKYKRV